MKASTTLTYNKIGEFLDKSVNTFHMYKVLISRYNELKVLVERDEDASTAMVINMVLKDILTLDYPEIKEIHNDLSSKRRFTLFDNLEREDVMLTFLNAKLIIEKLEDIIENGAFFMETMFFMFVDNDLKGDIEVEIEVGDKTLKVPIPDKTIDSIVEQAKDGDVEIDLDKMEINIEKTSNNPMQALTEEAMKYGVEDTEDEDEEDWIKKVKPTSINPSEHALLQRLGTQLNLRVNGDPDVVETLKETAERMNIDSNLVLGGD